MVPIVAAEGSTLDAGLSTLATVVTYIFSLVGEVCTTIVSTPILLLPVGIMMAGAGIGLSQRFIGR